MSRFGVAAAPACLHATDVPVGHLVADPGCPLGHHSGDALAEVSPVQNGLASVILDVLQDRAPGYGEAAYPLEVLVALRPASTDVPGFKWYGRIVRVRGFPSAPSWSVLRDGCGPPRGMTPMREANASRASVGLLRRRVIMSSRVGDEATSPLICSDGGRIASFSGSFAT